LPSLFINANPGALRAKLLLATIYVEQEKYDIALSASRQVSDNLPNDYYAQHVMGLALSGLNRLDEAETRFKRRSC
jgi:tetratricopeptide (TPR) repeat protein